MRQVLAVVGLMVVSGCTAWVPPPAPPGAPDCTGDVAITTRQELEAFVAAGCTSVVGSLTIRGTSLTSVVIPGLTGVGALDISENLDLASVSLPSLTTASWARPCPCCTDWLNCPGGLLVSGNPALERLELPALTTVDSLSITGNPALSWCVAEAVRSRLLGFAGALNLSGNDATATCPGGACSGDPVLTSDQELTSFIARGCRTLSGTLRITGTELASVELGELATVDQLMVENASALTTLSLPAMTSLDRLVVDANPNLARLRLPVLASLGDGGLRITSNPLFPQCWAEGILARLIRLTGPATISGNDGSSAPCGPPVQGLVGWWPADGDATDLAGTNHGLVTGALAYTPGVLGQAFLFDGYTSVETPVAGLPLGPADRTLGLWARVDDLPSWDSPFRHAFFGGYGLDFLPNHAFVLSAEMNDFTGDCLQSSWSQWGLALTGTCLQVGRWYHLAATYQAGVATYYVDGLAVGSAPFDIDTAAAPAYYGRLPPEGGSWRRLVGAIDDIRVYDRALEPQEVWLLAHPAR